MGSGPEASDADPVALRDVTELIRSRGAVAQICAMRHGRVILDHSFGCRPDALFLLFSAGKPFEEVMALVAGAFAAIRRSPMTSCSGRSRSRASGGTN